MAKIILHGGFSRDENEQNDAFWKEFTRDLKDGAGVLMVYFARPEDEGLETRFAKESARIAAATNAHLNIVMADEEAFSDQIRQADAIFFQGGNSPKLLEKIRKYPEFPQLIHEKTLAGDSAGAYLFSTYRTSASTGEVHEGLGILPIRLVCHYQSTYEKFEHTGNEIIEKMNKYPNDLELVVLRDYEWRVFET